MSIPVLAQTDHLVLSGVGRVPEDPDHHAEKWREEEWGQLTACPFRLQVALLMGVYLKQLWFTSVL
eukprot:1968312-Amphidinium_carterae.2